MALLQLRDYSDEVAGPGFVPIPAKASKRARTKLLPGSCAIIEPRPSSAGESRPCPCGNGIMASHKSLPLPVERLADEPFACSMHLYLLHCSAITGTMWRYNACVPLSCSVWACDIKRPLCQPLTCKTRRRDAAHQDHHPGAPGAALLGGAWRHHRLGAEGAGLPSGC